MTFADGETSTAGATVPDAAEISRAVLQWKGETGLQIHALEFGADYGGLGHVWYGAPGDPAVTVSW